MKQLQRLELTIGNARSPTLSKRVKRTIKASLEAERRCRQEGTLATR